MQVNAILSSTDGNGKKQTTTITHLRPSQKGKAVELATALNALTTNTYTGTQVNEINVDITSKQTPTLTLGEWTTATNSAFCPVNYTGDGELYVTCTKPAYIYTSSNQKRLEVITTSGTNFTGTIYAKETDNYEAISLNFSHSQ